MHKKRMILIIAIVSVVVVFQLILVFYSIPFVFQNGRWEVTDVK